QALEFMVLLNDAALTDERLNVAGVTKLGQIRSAGLTDSTFVMGCCITVRKEFLDLILPIPKDFPEHDNWIVNLAEGIGQKKIVAKVLQFYRRHENNESNFIANQLKEIKKQDIVGKQLLSFKKRIKNNDEVS